MFHNQNFKVCILHLFYFFSLTRDPWGILSYVVKNVRFRFFFMEKLAIKQDKICFRFQNSRAKGRTDPRPTFFDVTTGRLQVLDIAFGSRGWIAAMLFIISGPVSGPVSMCAI